MFHILVDDDDRHTRMLLEDTYSFEEIYITRAGSVISSHCGPGTLGILFVEKHN